MAGLSARERREQAQAILDMVTRSVVGLDAPARAKIIPALRQAEAEVRRDLRAWLSSQRPDDAFTAQRYKNALGAIRTALRAVEAMEPVVKDGLRASARKAAHLAVENVERELDKLGAVFEPGVIPAAIDQAVVLARGDRVVFKRHAASAKRYAGAVGDDVVRELAVSRARGETIREATDRLMKRIPHVFEGARSRAMTLARTETMAAYAEYHQDGIREAAKIDPEVVQRWDASLDGRTCAECYAFHDQVVAPEGEQFSAKWTETRSGGKRAARRASVDSPPAHPNCRCVTVAWKVGWDLRDTTTNKPAPARSRK